MLKGSNDIVQILFLFSGSGNCDVGRHNYAPIMYLKAISIFGPFTHADDANLFFF